MAKAATKASRAQPLVLPHCTQFDMTSKLSGHAYRIFIFRPPVPPPEGGLPVIYFTDGNLSFPIAMAMGGCFGMFVNLPALVVGVGYAVDTPLDVAARARDMTPPTPMSAIDVEPGMPPPTPENYGHADDFRRFLVEELRPRLAAEHPVDAGNETLFGYSLGGLFALDVLFNHPDDFRGYAICSPAIWWNKRAVLKNERAFAKLVEAKTISPRVLITVGAEEQTPPDQAPEGMTLAAIRKLIRSARMVDNARELGERLAALKGGNGYASQFQAFEREDHMTAMAAAVSRTLAFALRP
jgi:predicted alpha/beta superfamily hydrolase